MFEQFSEYITKMKAAGSATIRANHIRGMISKIQDPEAVKAALDQGSPSILSQLITLDNIAVLKAIVTLCDFKDPKLFLRQPGYLALKLMTLHTGKNKPEFPGFDFVAQSVQKGKLSEKKAIKQYSDLASIYSLGVSYPFECVINDLLNTGSTTKSAIVIPIRGDAKDALDNLVRHIFSSSYNREALRQIILQTNITSKGSFADQGKAIIKAIATKGYTEAAFPDFIRMAKALYIEQPEHINQTWDILFSQPPILGNSKGTEAEKLHRLLHGELLDWDYVALPYAYALVSTWSKYWEDNVNEDRPSYDQCKTLAEFVNQQSLITRICGLKNKELTFIQTLYKAAYGEGLSTKITAAKLDLLLKSPQVVEIPPNPDPKTESNISNICLKLLSVAVFTYAIYKGAGVASSELSGRLPGSVLEVLTNLPASVKQYGPIGPSLIIGGLVTTSNTGALLVCLVSAASSIASYKEDYKPALVTLAAIAMGVINYVSTKDQGNGR